MLLLLFLNKYLQNLPIYLPISFPFILLHLRTVLGWLSWYLKYNIILLELTNTFNFYYLEMVLSHLTSVFTMICIDAKVGFFVVCLFVFIFALEFAGPLETTVDVFHQFLKTLSQFCFKYSFCPIFFLLSLDSN